MAISLGHPGAGLLGGAAASMLFQRLPDRLFGPLASQNRHRYWILLCHLHRKRFGPDAPLPPGDGFASRDITRDIEDALTDMDEWESEADEAPATAINVRANIILQILIEAGWLRIDRQGFERRLFMAPAVSHFLSQLIAYAETGPVFVAGKIRSVELNLQAVLAGANGDTLMEAAETARNLLEHVRNTGTNVRDLMDRLGVEVTTREYVRLFFSDYIETVFIGDYRQLRTKDHPLAHRARILAQIDELYGNDVERRRLISWYQSWRTNGDEARALRMFERDIARLHELSMIDEYLDRLDDEIRRANKRALVFLDYRLRSSRPLDAAIATAINKIVERGETEHLTGFAPGRLVGPAVLAEPRQHVKRKQPDALRKRIPSAADIARAQLMAKARAARSVTVPELAEYVLRHLGNEDAVESAELTVESIKDARVLQTISAVALSMSSASRQLNTIASLTARGFRAEFSGDEEVTGEYMGGKPFLISIRKRNN
ncbi:Wadjet anti-phage system protein JetA family protein [Paraburkholderia sp. GAS82]|uniref:Wadjet anti-phage system protein JetA family protein n=1 Tax=Paraburkholderia sp. GAS82 TaxID=3035137 RepID=UPI003D21550C